MDEIVIEHVKVSELPEAWRERLAGAEEAHVTVRIERETSTSPEQAMKEDTNDPLFGMWRDLEDVADVQAYVRKLRAPRY